MLSFDLPWWTIPFIVLASAIKPILIGPGVLCVIFNKVGVLKNKQTFKYRDLLPYGFSVYAVIAVFHLGGFSLFPMMVGLYMSHVFLSLHWYLILCYVFFFRYFKRPIHWLSPLLFVLIMYPIARFLQISVG